LHLVARQAPDAARPLIKDLRYSAKIPRTAVRLVALLDDVGALGPRVGPEFLELAAANSRATALRLLAYVAEERLKAEQMSAILRGASQVIELPADGLIVEKALRAPNNQLPLVERLGAICVGGGIETAAAAATAVEYTKNIPRQLFVFAERVLGKHPSVAERRLKLAEAWRGATEVRADASRGYQSLFAKVENDAQLAVVLASALRYFDRPKDIPDIGALRTAGLAAAERVGSAASGRTQELVQEAFTQLRWEVGSKKNVVNRIRGVLGI
jgi:hypothetical protein